MMRAVVTRVLSASCEIDGDVTASIGPGLLVLVGAGKNSNEGQVVKLADRIAGLRIFSNAEGKMNLGLEAVESGQPKLLVVSNFTLYGDVWASRRPSFTSAAPYEEGLRLYNSFVEQLRSKVGEVQTGVFGADMRITSVNDGPVTLVIDA